MQLQRPPLRFVPPAPFNEARLAITLPELRVKHTQLSRALSRAVPRPILRGLLETKWKFHFTALASDHLGKQEQPYKTDADDNRQWNDQIGGSCGQRSLYVALFHAVDKELTRFTSYNHKELLGVLRHEIAHAFDRLLKDLLLESGLPFSAYSNEFMDAVWQDTLAAGGVPILRSHGYGYYTPGPMSGRWRRHLDEVFAEGMAIIWGGGSEKYPYNFTKRFPRSMAVLRELNDKFCATDFSNEASRAHFISFLEEKQSRPSMRKALCKTVDLITYRSHLPKLQEWNGGPLWGRFFDYDDMAIGKMAQVFEKHPRLLSYGLHGKIHGFIEDFAQIHEDVFLKTHYGNPGGPTVRGILHELTNAFVPAAQIERHIGMHAQAIGQAAIRNPEDSAIACYPACDKELTNHSANQMERLLLAKAVRVYAACHLDEPAPSDTGARSMYLKRRYAAVQKIEEIIDIMRCDAKSYEDPLCASFEVLEDALGKELKAFGQNGPVRSARPDCLSRNEKPSA